MSTVTNSQVIQRVQELVSNLQIYYASEGVDASNLSVTDVILYPYVSTQYTSTSDFNMGNGESINSRGVE